MNKWYSKYLLRSLRRIFNWSPERRKARAKAAGTKFNTYYCEQCNELFERSQTHVDHKEPVVEIETGFKDWNTYIERLFCDASNLQVLCISCHKTKSKAESVLRRTARQKRKTSQKKRKVKRK